MTTSQVVLLKPIFCGHGRSGLCSQANAIPGDQQREVHMVEVNPAGCSSAPKELADDSSVASVWS